MTWQDVVLAVGQWVFIAALLPSVFGKDKPAFSSSIITGTVLVVYAFTFISLNLWVGAISTFITAFTWYVLAYQKYRIHKREKG